MRDLDYYIRKSIEIHGDVFDFSQSEYTGSTKKIKIIHKECGGVFWKSPNNLTHSKRPQGCTHCSNERTGNKSRKNLDYYRELCDNVHGVGRFIIPDQPYTTSIAKYDVVCMVCGKTFKISMNLLTRSTDRRGCCVNNGSDQRLSDEEVQEKIDSVWGVEKYTYKHGTYTGQTDPAEVYCHTCEEWFTKPCIGNLWNPTKPTGHMKCSINGGHSGIEARIKDFLNENNINWYTDRVILDGKEIDFYLPDHKIGIEINGIFWHSEYNKPRMYHKNKTDIAESKGVQLLHIREDMIVEQWDKVQSILMAKLGMITNRIYARKCKVVELEPNTSAGFLDMTHISGNVPASIRYGLEYNGTLVAVMTFGKARYDKSVEYELYRYAQSLETVVVGGFSKLLKHFMNTNNSPSLVSYAHRDFSNGSVYEKSGFVYSHNTHPEHLWFHASNPYRLLNSRSVNRIVKSSDEYDPTKSLVENAKIMKYNRIYNSGSKVYYLGK